MKILLYFLISISICVSKATYLSTRTEQDEKNVTLSYTSIPPSDAVFKRYMALKEQSVGLNLKGRLREAFVLEAAMQDPYSNVVCSPISGLLPLGKLALGANGSTQEELYHTIGVSNCSDLSSFKNLIKDFQQLPGVNLTIVSRIYVSEGVKIIRKFRRKAKEIFQSSIATTSFSNPAKAADDINAWVSQETKGMIPTLIKPDQITEAASMIIVNAIHFKGKWKTPFKAKSVKLKDFFAPSVTKKVQMMTREGWYHYREDNVLKAQIMEIPYEGSEATFVIVLPFKTSDVPVLTDQLRLDPKLLDQAIIKLERENVKVTIPKFTITSTLDLKYLYNKIGMHEIFGFPTGLTGIVKDTDLRISSAVQKAVIEVDETGTEASAASYVTIMKFAAPNNISPIVFNADRPFLYYVKAYGEQIFGGILIEP